MGFMGIKLLYTISNIWESWKLEYEIRHEIFTETGLKGNSLLDIVEPQVSAQTNESLTANYTEKEVIYMGTVGNQVTTEVLNVLLGGPIPDTWNGIINHSLCGWRNLVETVEDKLRWEYEPFSMADGSWELGWRQINLHWKATQTILQFQWR